MSADIICDMFFRQCWQETDDAPTNPHKNENKKQNKHNNKTIVIRKSDHDYYDTSNYNDNQ